MVCMYAYMHMQLNNFARNEEWQNQKSPVYLNSCLHCLNFIHGSLKIDIFVVEISEFHHSLPFQIPFTTFILTGYNPECWSLNICVHWNICQLFSISNSRCREGRYGVLNTSCKAKLRDTQYNIHPWIDQEIKSWAFWGRDSQISQTR